MGEAAHNKLEEAIQHYRGLVEARNRYPKYNPNNVIPFDSNQPRKLFDYTVSPDNVNLECLAEEDTQKYFLVQDTKSSTYSMIPVGQRVSIQENSVKTQTPVKIDFFKDGSAYEMYNNLNKHTVESIDLEDKVIFCDTKDKIFTHIRKYVDQETYKLVETVFK